MFLNYFNVKNKEKINIQNREKRGQILVTMAA